MLQTLSVGSGVATSFVEFTENRVSMVPTLLSLAGGTWLPQWYSTMAAMWTKLAPWQPSVFPVSFSTTHWFIYWDSNKMEDILLTFSNEFLERKSLCFDSIPLEICSSGSNWKYISNFWFSKWLGDVRAVITWTNRDAIMLILILTPCVLCRRSLQKVRLKMSSVTLTPFVYHPISIICFQQSRVCYPVWSCQFRLSTACRFHVCLITEV